MKKSFRNAGIIAALILALTVGAIAQPMFGGPGKGWDKGDMKCGRQKIENMKKMKLLEYLDLNEDQADKFLVKYSAGSKIIMDNMKKADDISDKLRDAMKDNSGSKESVALADELVRAQKSIDDAKGQMLDNMKSILPAEKFTKYVYFEANFQKEVMKRMMQKHREKSGDDDERPGPGRR